MYGNWAPKSVENFLALVDGTAGVGESGKPLHYEGTKIHYILPGYMIRAGDITKEDGTGGESIFGRYFDDENLAMGLRTRYMLSWEDGNGRTRVRNQNDSRF